MKKGGPIKKTGNKISDEDLSKLGYLGDVKEEWFELFSGDVDITTTNKKRFIAKANKFLIRNKLNWRVSEIVDQDDDGMITWIVENKMAKGGGVKESGSFEVVIKNDAGGVHSQFFPGENKKDAQRKMNAWFDYTFEKSEILEFSRSRPSKGKYGIKILPFKADPIKKEKPSSEKIKQEEIPKVFKREFVGYGRKKEEVYSWSYKGLAFDFNEKGDFISEVQYDDFDSEEQADKLIEQLRGRLKGTGFILESTSSSRGDMLELVKDDYAKGGQMKKGGEVKNNLMVQYEYFKTPDLDNGFYVVALGDKIVWLANDTDAIEEWCKEEGYSIRSTDGIYFSKKPKGVQEWDVDRFDTLDTSGYGEDTGPYSGYVLFYKGNPHFVGNSEADFKDIISGQYAKGGEVEYGFKFNDLLKKGIVLRNKEGDEVGWTDFEYTIGGLNL